EAARGGAGSSKEGDRLGALPPPAARELLDDQLRVEEHRDLGRAEIAGEGEGPDDAGVLGDVVRLDAQEVRDRRVRRRERVARVRPRGVDQDRPGGRGTRVAAGGAVGPDDESAPRGTGDGASVGRHVGPERRGPLGVGQGGLPSVVAGSTGAAAGAASPLTEAAGAGAGSAGAFLPPPRILRRNSWTGS